MRQGRAFKRGTRCGKRVPDRRCPGCGVENAFSWAYVVDVAPPGAPRQQQTKGGFKTKSDALAAMNRRQTSKADGNFIEPSKLTTAAYLEQWLVGVRGEIRASTAGTYELAVRRLRPLIGSMPLQ